MQRKKKYRRAKKKGEIELRLLPFLVNPQKMAIDVGANTGLYTYYLAKTAKRVIAFEPHEKLYEFLCKAAPSNVTLINKCLSDKTTTVDFHIPIVNGKVSYNISSLEADMVCEHETYIRKVKSVTLDKYNFENVGFIKIDVEGHEMKVLQGALKTIQTSKPVLQIEILADQSVLKDHEVVRLLSDQNYEMLSLKNDILSIFGPSKNEKISRNFIFLPKF